MRVGRCFAAMIFGAGLCAAAAAAQPILLSGTIGKAPVLLDLDRTGDTVSGWYFYLKVGKQLRLEGKLDPSGFFTIEEFTAATNSRTGTFKGRVKNGHWSGTWSSAAGRKTLPMAFDEVRDKLQTVAGRFRCKVRAHDDDFATRTVHSLDLKLGGGQVSALTLKLDETSDGGDEQSCHIATADLKQVPATAGILLRARADRRSSEHHCSIRIFKAGDYLVLRTGDPSQKGDDCRGAGSEMFCSPRAFWLDLVVNRQTQVCRQVK